MLNKKLKPILFSIIITGITVFFYISFIKTQCVGNYWAAFEPGTIFKTPEFVPKNFKIRPIRDPGWDGQFYLYQSYDPFISHKKEILESFDAPAYRYQRNLIPFLTWLTNKITGIPNPSIYPYIQLFFIFLSALFLAYFLQNHGLSMWLLIPLQFNPGTYRALQANLPDPSADALFFICIILLFKKRLFPLMFFLTLLCLTREAYSVFAVCIFLLAIFGKWNNTRPFSLKALKPSLILIIPVLFFLCWQCFIILKLGAFPFRQGAGMVAYPFHGIIHLILNIANQGSRNWLGGIYLFILDLIILYFLTKWVLKNILWMPILAYVFLITCISYGGWQNWADQGKNYSSLFGVIVVMLCFLSQEGVRKKIILFLMVGTIYSFYHLCMALNSDDPYDLNGHCRYNINKIGGIFKSHVLSNCGYRDGPLVSTRPLRGNLKIIDYPRRFLKHGCWGYTPLPVTIQMANTSSQSWSPFYSDEISNPLQIKIEWMKEQNSPLRKFQQKNIPLNKFIYPGESQTIVIYLQPPFFAGKYYLNISLAQKNSRLIDVVPITLY